MKSTIKSTCSTGFGKCFSRGRPSTGAVSMINKTQSGAPAGWVGGGSRSMGQGCRLRSDPNAS